MSVRTRDFDAATVRKLAGLAEVDPRSMARRLRGEFVRGMTGHRIERIIKLHGVPVAPVSEPKKASGV